MAIPQAFQIKTPSGLVAVLLAAKNAFTKDNGLMSAFDAYANIYDEDFSRSTIGLLQRTSVHRYLQTLPLKTYNVLEVGGGTGVDALFFAQQCKQVIYSDASKGMFGIATQKFRDIQNITAVLKPAQTLSEEFVGAHLIYSGFGALNCLSPQAIQTFATSIAEKATTKVDVVLVVMSRRCLWEQLYFRIKGNKKEANRRKRMNATLANAGGEKIATWYYSPKELMVAFGDRFLVKELRPIGLFIPPSYLQPFFTKHPNALKGLAVLDGWMKGQKMAANYADHFLMHLQLITDP